MEIQSTPKSKNFTPCMNLPVTFAGAALIIVREKQLRAYSATSQERASRVNSSSGRWGREMRNVEESNW